MEALLSLQGYSDWGLLALRLALGAIFLAHGKMKRGLWPMQPSDQMPAAMLWKMKLLSVAEPLGGLAVILGLLTRWAALGFIIIMLGAIYYKIQKWHSPFAAQDKIGWEFDLLILASSLALLFSGPGAYALDRWL